MSVLVCALALSLVVDVSRSIDDQEYQLQMEGMARAFRSERILNVIENNNNPIVINLITFGDTAIIQVPWTILRTREDVLRISTTIQNIPNPNQIATNVLGGLDLSLNTFETLPCESDDKIIDISGDGVNSVTTRGLTEQIIVEKALSMNVRINTLPILTADLPFLNEQLYDYFNDNFALPTGGFSVRSTGFEDFHRAIFQKLSMEIALR